jgi:chemotaxis signal transduction protein
MVQQIVPWVLIRLEGSMFAVECSWVREMLLLPDTTALPVAVEGVRGLITLRDTVIPIVDLRKILGMRSVEEESQALVAMFNKRAEDHRRWLTELEASVREGREFGLTLDPHQCAFGRWYDAYKPQNVVLESHLKRFDQPHKAIHALGTSVANLVKAGKLDEALELIGHAHSGILVTLMKLFEETPAIMAAMNREMAIVLRGSNRVLGITADTVESVEAIKPDTKGPIPGLVGANPSSLVTCTARTAKTDRLVLLLDVEKLIARFTSGRTAGAIDNVPAIAA